MIKPFTIPGKRLERREIITRLIKAGFDNFRFLSYLTRRKEIETFGHELRIY